MNILTLPLRNLRRKPLRALLLGGVFALGLTAVIALGYVSQNVGHSLETKLLSYGANILIMPRTETLTVSYGGIQLGDMALGQQGLDLSDVDQAVRDMPLGERISAVAPKLVTSARIKGKGIGVVGVRWQDELRLKGFWAVHGEQPSTTNDILAGSRVAQALDLEIGDELDLLGRLVRVSGILQPTGSDDDKVLFADLGLVQGATERPGATSFVEVAALCSGCPIEDIVAQLRAKLPDSDIMALKDVVQQRMYSVHFVQRVVLAVSLIILLTACAMVGLSMLASVNERRKEIGIFRSLGYSSGHVFAIFFTEALFIGIAAGLTGYLTGWAAGGEVVRSLEVSGQSSVPFRIPHLMAAMGASTFVAGLSATLPALKASKVRPHDALASL